VGRTADAIEETTRAQNLEPFSPATTFAVGWALTAAGQYDRMMEHFRRALQLDPGSVAAHHFIGLGYVGKRMYGPAVTEFRQALKLSQERLLIQAELGFAEGAAGNAPEARRILTELRMLSRTRYVSPYYYALIYAGLGDNDAALAALEEAYRDRSRRLWALGIVPTWDPLRSDPRFRSLLNGVGLEGR
jgi:tetratricopeptide (TPR) repeat protein